MSQHDLDVGNANGATFRSDLNDGLQALGSTSKGGTAPTTAYSGQMWLDDSGTPWVVKVYDGTSWIPAFEVNATTNLATAPTNFVNTDAVQAGNVTNGKLADMSEARIKGRADGGGTGSPGDLTGAQVAAIIGGSISLYGVGTLLLARYTPGTALNPGTDVSGAVLLAASAKDDVAASAPSGTWKCLGRTVGGSADNARVTLFMRIA